MWHLSTGPHWQVYRVAATLYQYTHRGGLASRSDGSEPNEGLYAFAFAFDDGVVIISTTFQPGNAEVVMVSHAHVCELLEEENSRHVCLMAILKRCSLPASAIQRNLLGDLMLTILAPVSFAQEQHCLSPGWEEVENLICLLSPREYTLVTRTSREWASPIQGGTPVAYWTHESTGWARETTAFADVTNVHAYPVVGWNINRPGIGPATYATATATGTSSFDAASSTSTHAPIPANNGISAGAKVALGVGISVAIMGVMVGAFLVDSRLKRHIERGIATIPHPWRYGRESGEFEVPLYSPGGTPQQPLAELSAVRDPVEMEG
ncbi:hypothetical protein AFLA_011318 [Aspergillus flavus NRRL3357]|nr:hypothetical protein AFLA_011318 [Aspergillus flavus NRRL3357]